MISNLVRLFKTFFFLTFVVHLLACLWIRIGMGIIWQEEGSNWIEEFGLDPEDKF